MQFLAMTNKKLDNPEAGAEGFLDCGVTGLGFFKSVFEEGGVAFFDESVTKLVF
jgi:hypothetical protein